MSTNRLKKDRENGMWAGVLYGIAEGLEIDPALLRIGYVLMTMMMGGIFGFILYVIAACCIPDKSDDE